VGAGGFLTDDEVAAWNAHLFKGELLSAQDAERLDETICRHTWAEEPKPDDGWTAAWDDACSLNLNDFVEVEVTIAPEFQNWLENG